MYERFKTQLRASLSLSPRERKSNVQIQYLLAGQRMSAFTAWGIESTRRNSSHVGIVNHSLTSPLVSVRMAAMVGAV